MLSTSHGLPDAKLAAKISELELTERASTLRLEKWRNELSGKRTREALLALADASAFLDLPSTEILTTEKPDAETRRKILDRMVRYVNTTTHKLPDFMATRSTTHLDDLSSAQEMVAVGIGPDGYDVGNPPSTGGSRSMHVVGSVAAAVTYRNGHEVTDDRTNQNREATWYGNGLAVRGEFGSILSFVVKDAITAKIFWSRWEKGVAAPMAVFCYRVPQALSHYTVDQGERVSPAYHGELAIDPANGAILRISVVADLVPPGSGANPASKPKAIRPSQIINAAIVVEYAPVIIGDTPYICPSKSVALWRTAAWKNVTYNDRDFHDENLPPLTFVNDVSFTQYHLFRADVRIVQ